MNMSDVNEHWKRVWTKIDERRLALGMSLRILYELTGISETTFSKMRRFGTPVAREDNIAAICRALEWSDESINLILANLDPITFDDVLADADLDLEAAYMNMSQDPDPDSIRAYAMARAHARRVHETAGRPAPSSSPEIDEVWRAIQALASAMNLDPEQFGRDRFTIERLFPGYVATDEQFAVAADDPAGEEPTTPRPRGGKRPRPRPEQGEHIEE